MVFKEVIRSLAENLEEANGGTVAGFVWLDPQRCSKKSMGLWLVDAGNGQELVVMVGIIITYNHQVM